MDPLQRLTKLGTLEKAWEAKSQKITVIDEKEFASELKTKVIGQDEVIDHIARTLKRRIAAKRPNKPLAVFCFAGAPGVGKTYLAKVMAEAIFRGKNNRTNLAMRANWVSTLFGRPKGYTGSDSYGVVTAALRDVPNSIMLLDEFEKAPGDVHKRFLTAWNDGFVTELSDGTKIATTETIFVLTTNAQSRRIGEMARDHKGTMDELDRLAKGALGDSGFAPEVLSRIDNVFAFREMKGLDIARVVALLIEDQAKEYQLELAEGGIDPQILLGAIDKVMKEGAKGGVREIARGIEDQIADGLVDAKIAGAAKVQLVAADDDTVQVIPIHEPGVDNDSGNGPAHAVSSAAIASRSPLSRLTDIDSLGKSWEEKSAKLTVIDEKELAAKIKEKVIGQADVIDHIARTLKRRIAARRKNKPLAVFCFAGSPGVGKTYLAKVMAEEIYKSKNHLLHVDMSTMNQGHAASTLFGSGKGYWGSESYGMITRHLRDIPNSIILLDEFEKAAGDVHKRFLTAWNDGFVTEMSDGAKLPTNEAIFVLTTNAASRRIGEMARNHKGTQAELDRLVKSTLADVGFAPEVLSRIDNIFAFREMEGLDIATIVALLIEEQTKQYKLELVEGGIDQKILMDAIEMVTEEGAKGGVREIARGIEDKIADGLVDAKNAGAKRVRLVADGKRVTVVPVSDKADDAAPTEVGAAAAREAESGAGVESGDAAETTRGRPHNDDR